MKTLKNLVLILVALLSTATVLSSCGDDEPKAQTDYDVIQINGENYACYGYRCLITYSSDWNLSTHRGILRLPCGKLADAQKGDYDYDYAFSIYLEGSQDLKKGSKLENFSPMFEDLGVWTGNYASGTATVTDKKDDEYITVKFDSFKFVNGGKSYVLKGTVQLDLDED